MAGDKEVIDIGLISLDGLELEEVISMEITDTDPGAEAVATMNRRRRAIGFKQGVSTFEVSMEIKKVNPPEVDYLALKSSRKRFLLRYQENESGAVFRLSPSIVSEVSKSFNSDGEMTESVTILSLEHVAEIASA